MFFHSVVSVEMDRHCGMCFLLLKDIIGFVHHNFLSLLSFRKAETYPTNFSCFITQFILFQLKFNANAKSYNNVVELSFIFCSIYLLLGMALIAMCFNLMQVSYQPWLSETQKKKILFDVLGIICRGGF